MDNDQEIIFDKKNPKTHDFYLRKMKEYLVEAAPEVTAEQILMMEELSRSVTAAHCFAVNEKHAEMLAEQCEANKESSIHFQVLNEMTTDRITKVTEEMGKGELSQTAFDTILSCFQRKFAEMTKKAEENEDQIKKIQEEINEMEAAADRKLSELSRELRRLRN